MILFALFYELVYCWHKKFNFVIECFWYSQTTSWEAVKDRNHFAMEFFYSFLQFDIETAYFMEFF